MADHTGRALEIGALYAALVSLRSERDSGARAVVSLGEGEPAHVAATDLIRAADLLASRKLRGWIAQFALQWWAHALTATSQVVSGTGTSSVAAGQYHAVARDASVLSTLVVETGGATSGTNECCRYLTSPNLYLRTGARFVFRSSAAQVAEIQVARWGLWGNNATPTSGARPTHGVWLEFDRAISTTLIYLCSADGGAVASVSTGITLDTSMRTWVIDQTALGFNVYEIETGTLAVIASTSTPVVSSFQAGTARAFWQITKKAAASGNWGDIYCPFFAPILAETYVKELP